MKNNKGITLVSLVIYIAIIMVVTAAVIRITTYFKNNMADVADVSFETEFQKINLYLLDEAKTTGNGIDEIINGTKIIFTNGNEYEYVALDKTIFLNDTIKICENVESCVFSQKTAENGKNVLEVTIKIGETTKTVEYVLNTEDVQGNEVNIDDYLIGASKVSYYLKAGDYVDYTPDTGTYKVVDGQYGSGYTTTKGYQEFTTETGANALKWRILSIDEQTGKIDLVSATAAQRTTPLYLKRADGYNHGVDILNDLCETLYSKTENGKKVATARSINVEDINAKTTFVPEKYKSDNNSEYNQEFKYSANENNYKKYPSLYEKERGFYIRGVKQTGGISESVGLDDGVIKDGVTSYSTVTGFIDDWDSENSTSKKDVSVTYTQYYYEPEGEVIFYLNQKLGINTVPKGLIKVEDAYWLASRCVRAEEGYGSFFIRYFGAGAVRYYFMFSSNGYGSEYYSSVRPVVTLDATQLLDFTIGDGSKENPWGMK